jgi:hypothetical protein
MMIIAYMKTFCKVTAENLIFEIVNQLAVPLHSE